MCPNYSHFSLSFVVCVQDGMATLGREEPSNTTEVPVYAINFGGTSQNRNSYLKYICEKSGGKYFDMTSTGGDGYNDELILAELGKPAMSFIRAEYADNEMSIVRTARCVCVCVCVCARVCVCVCVWLLDSLPLLLSLPLALPYLPLSLFVCVCARVCVRVCVRVRL